MMLGTHTTAQHPGAWPNGTRVAKINSDATDAHKDGATARVIGSVGADGLIVYFVEWDDLPGAAVAISAPRLRPVEGN